MIAVKARLLALLVVLPTLFAAAPALAQTPPRRPRRRPAGGRQGAYKIHSGLATSKMRYLAPQQEVVVRGRVKPAVPGEVLTLYAIRGNKASKSVPAQGQGRRALPVPLQGRQTGRLRLVIKHRRARRRWRSARAQAA